MSKEGQKQMLDGLYQVRSKLFKVNQSHSKQIKGVLRGRPGKRGAEPVSTRPNPVIVRLGPGMFRNVGESADNVTY
jgi:hypothetical protein